MAVTAGDIDLREYLIREGVDCPHQIEVFTGGVSPSWIIRHHEQGVMLQLSIDYILLILLLNGNEPIIDIINRWLSEVHGEVLDLDAYDNLEPEQWI